MYDMCSGEAEMEMEMANRRITAGVSDWVDGFQKDLPSPKEYLTYTYLYFSFLSIVRCDI